MTKYFWRIDRAAKELDWKSSKAETPRGFESHVLRQQTEVRNHFRFSFIRWNFNGSLPCLIIELV